VKTVARRINERCIFGNWLVVGEAIRLNQDSGFEARSVNAFFRPKAEVGCLGKRTFNVELTGAARLYRAASGGMMVSDHRDQDNPQMIQTSVARGVLAHNDP